MLTELLLGTVGMVGIAGGISALVAFRRNGHNGNAAPSPPSPPPQRLVIAELDELPEKLEQGLRPVFEEFFERIHEPEVPPEWSAQVMEAIGSVQGYMAAEPLWPRELIGSVRSLGEQLAASEAARPVLPPPVDLEPRLAEIAEKLEKVGQSLTERVSHGFAELLAAERARPKPSPPPAKNEGRGTPPPPPRSAPPNLPRLNPGATPGTPSIPAPYVAGSVYVPAGEVWSLLYLIQQQLSANCPGSGAEFAISADSEVFVGSASSLGGPLTVDNYGYALEPGDPPRIYRSTFPGSNVQIGALQILSSSGSWLHVEVQS